MSFTFSVSNMGCKANLTDAQDLEARLRGLGGIAVQEDADIFVLNTCTVTDQADREALQILKKANNAMVVATGCMAEVDPQKILAAKSGLKVIRNSGKRDLDQAIQEWLSKTAGEQTAVHQGDRSGWHKEVDFVSGASVSAEAQARTRSFLKVQDGCNAFCSYCIIPHARGRSRSLKIKDIISEVNKVHDSGVNEIVLTAIHAADFEDEGKTFTDLVEAVLNNTKIPRLRLTSLDPKEIPDQLLNLMRDNSRLCQHFHVSLQSACSETLRAMKRNYTGQEAVEKLFQIKSLLPNAYVGMDVIAGFPGETEQNFAESLANIQKSPWTKLHVFPFSERKSTQAQKMILAGLGIPQHIIRERAQKLRQLGDARFTAEMKLRVGQLGELLVEAKTKSVDGQVFSQGHIRSYFKVLIPGVYKVNQRLRVKMEQVFDQESLLGVSV